MFAILRKEINAFFASPIGYLVIGTFLVLNGLFLWIFKGEFNILDNGFSDLSSFFLLSPWILLFLIPAVTMRSFSEERKQGTLELLLTKPISKLQIVLGKYFGALFLILLALIPTLIYVYTVNELGNPVGNLDLGNTLGAYFGLLFLIMAYTAIGIFASCLTDNQIVAFIISVILCLIFYIGFEGVADILASNFVEQLGMQYHYKSLGRGIIDTRDLIYFLTLVTIFILWTKTRINKNFNSKKSNITLAGTVLGLFLLNVITSNFYERFDLTEDKRYTISDSSKELIASVDAPIIIDVYLEGDGFPSEFRRLRTETQLLLEEFANENSNILFGFINPIAEKSVRDQNIQQLAQRGLTPMRLSVQESGRSTEEVIFPWALASYNDFTVKVPLIKNKIGASQQELITNSVQHLEYAFSDAFKKLIHPKSRKIAVLRGNGQLENRYIADFVTTLRDYYFIAPYTLDSVSKNPNTALKELNEFDLIISAKPTESFSDQEKYVLDQFTMNGGKSLWLVDKVIIEKDSLYNESGSNVAVARDLNLTDFFFQYGARINPVLINDMYSAPITLAIGEGSQTQFQPIQWPYSPLAQSESNHPIVNNLERVKFDFVNQIDTLKNDVDKTILLKSSDLSRKEGVPKMISLDLIESDPDPSQYNSGRHNLAVLLEGELKSVYQNRVLPATVENPKESSELTKMIIIADGDVIKNEVDRNGPLELGFDRTRGFMYGNKEFLLNAVNYLLDDSGLINLRSKDVNIAFLDFQKVADEKTKWQFINVAAPLILLVLFGFTFSILRRRKYRA